MSKKFEAEQNAFNNWINTNAETVDIYKRYGHDFEFFMVPIIQNRIKKEGYTKYLDLTDEEINNLCKAIDEKNEQISKEPDENGVRHIPIWQGYNERDTIILIKAFVKLSSDDQNAILGFSFR